MKKSSLVQASLPSSVLAGVPADVADYLTSYVPKALTAAGWAACREAVLSLTAQTKPGTVSDGRFTAYALCEFLAWTELVLGLLDPAAAVTEQNVARWFNAVADVKTKGTRTRLRTRLYRVVRVLGGEPARTKRAPRRVADGPYQSDELEVLVATACSSEPLAVALGLALGSGLTIRNVTDGARVDADAARAFCRELGLADKWLAGTGGKAELDGSTWQAARRDAAGAGIPLIADRLRMTWLVHVLDSSTPFVELAPALALTRADLERSFTHVPGVDAAVYRELLRTNGPHS